MAGVSIEFDVAVRTRDGVVLRADVFRPSEGGPWPALLVRTPYNKQDSRILGILDPLAAVRRGYLVVIADTRGRFHSDGDWEPLRHERNDGYDTVRWVAALPGCDGRVGMYGPSYLGHTQWMAAMDGPTELAAIVPVFTWSDPFDGVFTRGGAIELGLGASWSLGHGAEVLNRRHRDDPALYRQRLAALVRDIDALPTTTYWELPAGAFPAYGRHQLPDLGYERTRSTASGPGGVAGSVVGNYHRLNVASLNVGGWFDVFLQGTLDNYVGLRAAGRPSTLLVGPWSHRVQTNQQGDVNYGIAASESSVDLQDSLNGLQLDWLDHWLKPDGAPSPPSPAVRIFVTGANVWRDEDDWPLPQARDTDVFLGLDGTLSFEAPATTQPPDRFVYDPADPVITHGGAVLMSAEYPSGPLDQSPVERRRDVLVYTSAPLSADLTVIGRITVVLYAESSAPSTDWVARLCDVDTDSVSRNLTDGIIRVGSGADAPGEHDIDLWSVAHVFRRGHRLRLQITSSNFPRWDRNLNTGEPVESGTAMRVAHQTIYHDRARVSRLILPVVQPTR